MKNRSRDEIIEFILKFVSTNQNIDKITVTRIMYSVLLSHSQLKEYIAYLSKREILQYNTNNRTYRLTDKGEQYLTIHRQLVELIHDRIKTS